jgi:glycosyltransferase involved in cell wall biosynthesis
MELSVIIPVRNGAGTLGAQLDALLAQSWVGAWEIVVVDNGSTDATCELVRAYAERDHRVRLVSAPAANGAGAVRNAGAARAHGNAYAFADADDVVGPTWVASIGEALRDHVAVAGRLEVAELNPAWLVRTRGTRLPTEAPATFHGCFAMLPAGNFGMQATVWKELGGFDESVVANEDAELSLRVWQRRIQVHYAPDAVVHYRYRREPSVLFRQGLRYGTYRVLVAQPR